MIYLDFSKKLQVIHIPKNGDYTGKIEDKPTFDEGYDKGYQDGLEDCECGECNEGSKYHIVKEENETLYASVDGLDGYSEVEINASEYGNKKYEEGYEQGKSECGECNIQETKWVHPSINDIDSNGYLVYYKDDGYDGMDRIALQMDNYNQEKYNQGYEQGKSECGEGGECNLDDLNVEWQANWNSNVWYAELNGFDGYRAVSINAERALQEKYEEGYEQGKSEGGNCNIDRLIEQLDVNNDGHIVRYAVDYGVDGWSYLDLDVNQYGNRKYEEGYNQGKSECPEGGSCNVQDGSFEFYDMENGHYWQYAKEYGLDGWGYIDIDASNYGRQKYNEGYEQGKSECGEGGDCPELTELNVVENGTYEGSFNKVNVTVNATDFSSEQVENKYSHLAFITRNFTDLNTIVDKTKLLDRVGNYIPNGSINITQFKNGICLAMDDKYLNPDFNTGCVVRGIEDGAIDWNAVEIFRSYTILEFGENMTRDKGSNLLNLYIYASTFRNETVTFNDGCFATSNRLNKIVFEEPFNVIVKGNPFEGISSWGQFIVKGIEANRSKYTDLINLLPSDWEVIFNPDYNE